LSFINADNTEVWVPYLGVNRGEFIALQHLIESYRSHFAASALPLVVVDQSEAVRKQLEQPETLEGTPVFRIHERMARSVPTPGFELSEIRKTLDELEATGHIRVRRPDARLFHSQCVNRIVNEWSQARFVLLLDSDAFFTAEGLCAALAAAYPEHVWETITAVGSLVDFAEVTRTPRWKQRALQWLGAAAPADPHRFARRWRLPRLHPYCLLLNRELIARKEINFQLLFLDVLEPGWGDDPRRAGRMLGDTGASLVLQSAQLGLRVGDFPMHSYTGHLRSASFAKDETSRDIYEWWT
jgi:hypothetical protein